VADISLNWRYGIIERYAPAFDRDPWVRTFEHISIWPGEDPELLARELEKEPARWLGYAKPKLRIHVIGI